MQLFILFLVSFLAATIFPAQSELFLSALYINSDHGALILISIASLGNILGSCVNWILGRYMVQFKDKKWFPIRDEKLDKASEIYNRYGIWSVLFAWVPFIGDPLTIVAGFLRSNFWLFLILVSIGKCGRYIFIIWLLTQ